MSSFVKIPCAECGTQTLCNSADSSNPQFCNEFCKARNSVLERRNQRNVGVTTTTKSKRIRGCSSCGG